MPSSIRCAAVRFLFSYTVDISGSPTRLCLIGGRYSLDCDEKDLNVEGEGEAEQFTKADGQTPVCSPDKSLAKEITKLPRILLQDVEDASISPTKTLMSGVGTVQMAS